MPPAPDKWKRLARCLPALILLVTGGWLLGRLLLGATVVGYRDSAYLYYPMLQALSECWASGRVPLWSPWDNYGFPVVADGSTAVFYPGKLILAWEGLSFPCRYGLYLSLHLGWAALGTWCLARDQRCHRTGATLAALAYAAGGPVLFQVTNVIYLVSAAWLPWALWSLSWAIDRQRPRGALAAAGCLAMMILGGDPQMVYHVGLIAGAWWLIRACARPAARGTWTSGISLGSMVLVTAGLAAVQLLPTLELTADSERAASGRVVNVYAAWSAGQETGPATTSAWTSLWQQTDQIPGQYEFSLPPWSLVELGVPNWSGRPFPRNQRWADGLPGADRMWYPSLYAGILVLLLALSRFRLWGGAVRDVRWSGLALGFTLGSFGWYGLAWAWRELTLAAGLEGAAPNWAAPVGGLYWWMSLLLPYYVSFRYPAKLFIVASLALAILAGRGLPAGSRRLGRARGIAVGGSLGAALLAAGVLYGGFLAYGLPWGAQQSATEFGPFEATACHRGVLGGLAQAWLVLALAGGLLHWGKRLGWSGPALAWLCVLLTAADLVTANAWLLAEVPASAVARQQPAGLELGPGVTLLPARDPFDAVAATSSREGLQRVLRWQQQQLTPKHHLTVPVRMLGSFHSIWPTAYLDRVQRDLEEARAAPAQAEPSSWLRLEYSAAPRGEGPVAVTAVPLARSPGGIDEPILAAAWDWNQAAFEVQVGPAADWIELPVWGDAHWQVQVRDATSRQPVVAAWRVSSSHLLEIQLDPGRYRIELDYGGGAVVRGGWISLLTLGGWLLALVTLPRRKA